MRAEFERLELALSEPFAIARGSRETTTNVVVRLTDSEGRAGVGAAAPSTRYGETPATVDVRVADTDHEQYVGLSRTDNLPDGEGMLFVHENEGTYAYVMPDDDDRNMSFPLDIIFIDADGQITTIHHAPLAENAEKPDQRYRGEGRYVLEVPYGWTDRTNITVGDHVSIPETIQK